MEEGTGMTTAQVGYAPVHCWVKAVLGRTHTTVVLTVAWAVLCLLVAQRVTAAALARALPAEQAGSGRSCLRRVRRGWEGPALAEAPVRPALLRPGAPPLGGPPLAALGPAAARPLEGLVGRHRHRWAPAPHRLGGHPISVAQGALPGHDAGAPPATSGRLPDRNVLDAGGGPRLSQRGAVCPVAPGWYGLQRAAAVERLGDGSWG